MPVKWHETIEASDEVPASHASLTDKTSIICRLGALILRTGAGGWRVRDAVNRASSALGVTSTVSVGLTDIECTVRDGTEQRSQTVVIPDSGVNTNMLIDLDDFLAEIDERGAQISVHEYTRKWTSSNVKSRYILLR